MNLAHSRTHWEDMGHLDPCWAILSEPNKRNGKWELAEFFATGETEIAQVISTAQHLGFPKARNRALDFGCGLGRLTRALTSYFDRVTGIDISRSMIGKAVSFERTGRCSFIVSDSGGLPLDSERFDLVVSNIVLQHVPEQKAIRNYIAEFARVLAPGGLIVMQLPSYVPWRRRIQARRRLYGWLRFAGISERVLYKRLHLHPIPMNFLAEHEVQSILQRNGCRVLQTVSDHRAGEHISSRTYYAAKDGECA